MLTEKLATAAQEYLDGPFRGGLMIPGAVAELGPLTVLSGDRMDPRTRAALSTMSSGWSSHLPGNHRRMNYYLMKMTLKNMGVSIPTPLQRFYAVSGWAAKAVDALVARSRFQGFVFDDDHVDAQLSEAVTANDFSVLYRQATTDELIASCAFVTVTRGGVGEPDVVINAYPASLATGLWNPRTKALAYGLAITSVDDASRPTRAVVYAPEATYDLERSGGAWACHAVPNSTGRPCMVCLRYRPSLRRPFGRSRVSEAVMGIVDEAVRESLREAVDAEMFTAPRRWISGATKDFAEKMSKVKDEAYSGSIMTITSNGGQNPQVGQFAASSMEPHISYMRDLAARFAGETNIPVSSLGVVSDNPSSAEAIYAAKEDLVIDAQDLNETNGGALSQMAALVMATTRGVSVDALEATDRLVTAQFRAPSMPSIVSQTDAMTKLAAVAPWVALSDVFLEEVGFNKSEVTRLAVERKRYQAQATVSEALASMGRQGAAAPSEGEE